MNSGALVIADATNSSPGTSSVPTGSMCLTGFQRHPTEHPRRVVAEHPGDVPMGRFVQRDREDHRHRPEHDGRERKIH